MHVRVSNRLYLTGFPPTYISELLEYCRLENPQYERWLEKNAGGKSWIQDKEPIQYFDLGSEEDCSFPLPLLQKILGDYPDLQLTSELVKPRANFKLRTDFTPWPHQAKAIAKAKNLPWCTIVSGTGSGKTKMMMALIAELGYKALFVVPNVKLMAQALADAREVFDCEFGQLGDKVKKIGDLTVATVQTLYNMDGAELMNEFGTVVFDEVDMFPMAWRKVLTMFACAHRYGDTATFERGDGNHHVLLRLLGPVAYRVPSKELLDAGILVKPTVEWVPTNYKVARRYTHETRPFLLRELARADERNQVVADTIRKLYGQGGNKIIVLTDLVEHIHTLAELLKDLDPIIYHGQLGTKEVKDPVTGKISVKKPSPKLRTALQDAAMAEIHRRPESITIATFQSMGRGTNVPSWNRLVVGLPFMSRTRGSQVMGRIMRQYQGKDGAVITDFEDDSINNRCPLIGEMATARKKTYKEIV